MRRPLAVDRSSLLAALTTRDEGLLGTYVDLHTGGLLRLYDPAIVGRNNDATEVQLDADPDRFARVPLYAREYRLMTAFVDTVDDDDLARLLDSALAGRSAFRQFDATLAAWPAERARWERYRFDALERMAVGWLRSLDVEPLWASEVTESEPEVPALVQVLLHGAAVPGGRAVDAGEESAAHLLFIRVCRELCETGQEPFRARHLRHTARFVYGGVEVRRDGTKVTVVEPHGPGATGRGAG
jgi:Uncharacterised protein family (UPF0158)